MKTVQDYMNDPRILNDPGLMAAPEELREIHAIRLKQYDETAGMSVVEKSAWYRQKAAALFAGTGTAPEIVNHAGQGKLKPRHPLARQALNGANQPGELCAPGQGSAPQK